MRERNRVQDFFVREAEPGDARQFFELQRTIVRERIYLIREPEEFTETVDQAEDLIRESARSRDMAVFAAVTGDSELLGAAYLKRHHLKKTRHTVGLGIAVRPEARGRGVGRALMARVMEWVRAHPALMRVELTVFETNERAMRLYRAFGLKEEGRSQMAFRIGDVFVAGVHMAVVLEKRLPSEDSADYSP